MSAGAGGEVLGYPELPDEFHGASHRSTLLHSRVSARPATGRRKIRNEKRRPTRKPRVGWFCHVFFFFGGGGRGGRLVFVLLEFLHLS